MVGGLSRGKMLLTLNDCTHAVYFLFYLGKVNISSKDGRPGGGVEDKNSNFLSVFHFNSLHAQGSSSVYAKVVGFKCSSASCGRLQSLNATGQEVSTRRLTNHDQQNPYEVYPAVEMGGVLAEQTH